MDIFQGKNCPLGFPLVLFEPHHEKTCLCHMQTIKVQIRFARDEADFKQMSSLVFEFLCRLVSCAGCGIQLNHVMKKPVFGVCDQLS